MSDENQIEVPPSFVAVYADRRGCLHASFDAVRARYEVCEDLALQLVEHAKRLYHAEAPSEAGILLGIHSGLATAASGLAPGEPAWVVQRLAELLSWACPALPTDEDKAD